MFNKNICIFRIYILFKNIYNLIVFLIYNTSRAGQAGGGSFKEKKCKSKKIFACRMCTG